MVNVTKKARSGASAFSCMSIIRVSVPRQTSTGIKLVPLSFYQHTNQNKPFRLPTSILAIVRSDLWVRGFARSIAQLPMFPLSDIAAGLCISPPAWIMPRNCGDVPIKAYGPGLGTSLLGNEILIRA